MSKVGNDVVEQKYSTKRKPRGKADPVLVCLFVFWQEHHLVGLKQRIQHAVQQHMKINATAPATAMTAYPEPFTFPVAQ